MSPFQLYGKNLYTRLKSASTNIRRARSEISGISGIYERDLGYRAFGHRGLAARHMHPGRAVYPRVALAPRRAAPPGKAAAPARAASPGKATTGGKGQTPAKKGKDCRLGKRAPTQTKVPIDTAKEMDLCENESMYSDDMTGCSAVAALWRSGTNYAGYFAHVSPTATTTQMTNFETVLKDAIEANAEEVPQATTLFMAKQGGAERCVAQNNLLRAMLRRHQVTFQEHYYETTQGGRATTIKLTAKAGDPFLAA
ncbi:hypothetical protein MMC19_005466 [Ptychographa xylographoides]|nr:hypothetical protein [Ptychographa xylographoides]